MSDKLLTAEDFEDKVDSEFTIDIDLDGVADITLKLVECERRQPNGYPDAQRTPFSLIFHGELSVVLHSQSYTLKCDKFKEPLDIFLTAVGQTDEATQYQAVFA